MRVRLATIGAVAAITLLSAAAKAETINIFAWTNAAPLPVLLGSGGPGFFNVSSGFGGATFTSISGAAVPPGVLDLSQTISLGITGLLASPVHIAVEVAGLGAPFVTGALAFTRVRTHNQ